MTVDIKPLSPQVGLEISGIDLDAPLDEGTQNTLRNAFIHSGILLFRRAAATPEAHLSLSRCFGELQRHPIRENWASGYPDLVDISYRPARDGASTVALGRRGGEWCRS